MSLLNDMLRDLSSVQHKPSALAGDDARAQLNESGLFRAERRPWLLSLLIFILVLGVCLGTKNLWEQLQTANVTESVSGQTINTKVVNVQPDDSAASDVKTKDLNADARAKMAVSTAQTAFQLTQSASSASLSFASDSLPSASADELSAKAADHNSAMVGAGESALASSVLSRAQLVKIGELLGLARAALLRDRLTSPFDDNAYSYYQQVLALDKRNPQALAGLTDLADRYLVIAKSSLAEGNLLRAKTLLHRAQLVAPEYAATQTFAEQLENSLAAQNNTDPAPSRAVAPDQISAAAAHANAGKLPGSHASDTSVTQIASATRPPSSADQAAAVQTAVDQPAVDQTPVDQTPVDQIPGDQTAYLSVTPNAQWQDSQQAQQAQQLIAQGKQPLAMAQLQRFLARTPRSPESTRVLLELYCQQGRAPAVEDLLKDADFLAAAERNYYKARLALMAQQDDQAIDLLESQLNTAQSLEHYRALLAGLYQKNARYAQAAETYRGLLSDFGEKPAYWLGYALALDALAQKSLALQAYKRLNQFAELQTEVRAYVTQRIQALSS